MKTYSRPAKSLSLYLSIYIHHLQVHIFVKSIYAWDLFARTDMKSFIEVHQKVLISDARTLLVIAFYCIHTLVPAVAVTASSFAPVCFFSFRISCFSLKDVSSSIYNRFSPSFFRLLLLVSFSSFRFFIRLAFCARLLGCGTNKNFNFTSVLDLS